MEPERRIEKWLRAFAKKRREQAGPPLELRPATRQRLQREIARQAEEKRRGFFSLFWLRPRLAFAVCFIALALGAWFLWPQFRGPQSARLSMNNASQRETLQNRTAPAAAPMVSPPIAGADKKMSDVEKPLPAAPSSTQPTIASANRALTPTPNDVPKNQDRAQDMLAQKQAPITTTASPAPATNSYYALKGEVATDSFAAAGASAKEAAGSTPEFATTRRATNFATNIDLADNRQKDQLAFALQKALAAPSSTNLATVSEASTVSQQFNRLEGQLTRRDAVTAGALKASTPVLTSFRVEQSGNNLKVVDADGSVYTGSVQNAQQEPAGTTIVSAAPNNTPASRLMRSASPAASSYFFRVAGTNRNLNENVVFSGNFVPMTNSQLASGNRTIGGFGGGGGFGGAGGRPAGQPVQAVLTNSRINGTVVIGNQKAADVVATPAP
jgi:hypothetical protein